MTGAAIAAYAGGYFHTVLGDYHLMFISAAIFGFIAVSLALRIEGTGRMMARPVAELAEPAPV